MDGYTTARENTGWRIETDARRTLVTLSSRLPEMANEEGAARAASVFPSTYFEFRRTAGDLNEHTGLSALRFGNIHACQLSWCCAGGARRRRIAR
jgi:hypothetical protein